ncbi:MAG: glycosyltransferase family 2 protein [Anaerolineae bacterium]
MIDHPRLSVIVVSWNVRDLLQRALESVYASWSHASGMEIVVVDNASSDGSPEMVETAFPEVTLLHNETNVGFASANNQGLEIARGDYLLLLNSDTEALGGALPELVSYLDAHPQVGLVGPRLFNDDGTTQSSRRRFPTLPILFLESTWLQRLMPRPLLNRYYVADVPDSEEQLVDWVTGAAMLVRREAITDAGPLDPGFFMYSEELDWCRRIRQAGWDIAYTPSAEIVHYGGKSSEQVAPARHIYFQSSKIRYARKYHGTVVAELLRLWLLGQYVWQSAVEGTKWILGHRRELRAARLGAYRRVIQSGLRQPSSRPE